MIQSLPSHVRLGALLNEFMSAWSVQYILEEQGHTTYLEDIRKELPEDPVLIEGFTLYLNSKFDLILVPMSLPNQASVRIAERVHLSKLAVKTGLLTGSHTATPTTCLPLFNYFIKSREIVTAESVQNILRPIRCA